MMRVVHRAVRLHAVGDLRVDESAGPPATEFGRAARWKGWTRCDERGCVDPRTASSIGSRL